MNQRPKYKTRNQKQTNKQKRPEIIKFLEENICRTLSEMYHSIMFMNLSPWTKEIKAKTNGI